MIQNKVAHFCGRQCII